MAVALDGAGRGNVAAATPAVYSESVAIFLGSVIATGYHGPAVPDGDGRRGDAHLASLNRAAITMASSISRARNPKRWCRISVDQRLHRLYQRTQCKRHFMLVNHIGGPLQ